MVGLTFRFQLFKIRADGFLRHQEEGAEKQILTSELEDGGASSILQPGARVGFGTAGQLTMEAIPGFYDRF
jgi:hypothetical protein